MLDDQKKIKLLEVNKPPCLDTLRGRATQLNSEKQTAIMEFDAVPEFCHSEAQIVQGGFITGMMDTCMAHLLIALLDFKFIWRFYWISELTQNVNVYSNFSKFSNFYNFEKTSVPS